MQRSCGSTVCTDLCRRSCCTSSVKVQIYSVWTRTIETTGDRGRFIANANVATGKYIISFQLDFNLPDSKVFILGVYWVVFWRIAEFVCVSLHLMLIILVPEHDSYQFSGGNCLSPDELSEHLLSTCCRCWSSSDQRRSVDTLRLSKS